MNLRFRFLLIVLGAGLVIATFTFPQWLPLLPSDQETFPFPELDPAFHAAFNALPIERQQDYLRLRNENLILTLDMINSALLPDVVVPPEAQTLPNIQGQVEIFTTEFEPISVNRSASGTVRVFELPDGSQYLWFEEFSAIQAPDMRVYLSRNSTFSLEDLDEDEELTLTVEDVFLGRVSANVGNQRFDIPRENDLSTYNSVMLFSDDLQLVYAIADL
ncbi:MAG: DM13 domain-containing protein [Anaerolineae bacterium]|jgi:hypothetical protein|nr:DM13 domain-containing protein [Anaerolineae bacterium]